MMLNYLKSLALPRGLPSTRNFNDLAGGFAMSVSRLFSLRPANLDEPFVSCSAAFTIRWGVASGRSIVDALIRSLVMS